ncbi:hypothetical protein BH11BAC5_BH11BAC5_41520 [soil metagenome]
MEKQTSEPLKKVIDNTQEMPGVRKKIKQALTAKEQQFVDFISNVIVQKTIKDFNEKQGNKSSY